MSAGIRLHHEARTDTLPSRRAYFNTLYRMQASLGRKLTQEEVAVANSFYQAGHEDKADEIQPRLTELELRLAGYQIKPSN